MSTKFLSPGWRMPRNANQSKQSNYSMQFDGSSHIDVDDKFNFVQQTGLFSISCWLKLDNYTSTTLEPICHTNNGGRLQDGFWLFYDNRIDTGSAKRLGFYFYGGNDNASNLDLVAKEDAFSDNDWHHIIVVGSSAGTYGTLTMYIDGQSVATRSLLSNSLTNDVAYNNFTIADYASNNQLNGRLSQISIFDYALSSSQVATLWGGGASVSNPMALPSPPIAYYPLGTSAWNGEYLAENNAIGDYVFDFGTYTSNDRIIINNTFDTIITGTNFTISSWVNLDSVTSNQLKFIFTNESLQFAITDKITTYLRGASGYFLSPFNGNTTLTTGEWYNVVLVKSGSDYTYYLNGSPDGTVNNSTAVVNSSQTTSRIGMFFQNSTYAFDGLLSNVQIFNTALSGLEAETLYNYGSPIRTLANIPQSSNLKAWYKLDASEVYNSTTTEWEVNEATSPWTSSLDFDGTDDSINVGTGNILTGVYSVSMWIKRTATSGGDSSQALFSKDNTSTQRSFNNYLDQSSGTLKMWQSANGSSLSVTQSSTAITDTNWHHVVYINPGSSANCQMYLDGTEVSYSSQNAGVSSIHTSAIDNMIGGHYIATSYQFYGSISNVSVWNTNLTSVQITEIYNNGTPSNLSSHSATSSLISWYKLNNTTTGIEDSKGSNNGTNNGATEVYGSVSTLNGESSGMSQANLVQSDLQTVAPYSKYALDFDSASSDAITLGNTIGNGFTQITCSIWANISTSGLTQSSYRNFLVKFPSGSGDATPFELRSNNGNRTDSYNNKLFFRINTNTGSYGFTDAGFEFTEANKWYHLVGTYDGSNVKLFVDGVEYYSISASGTLNSNNNNATIGKSGSTGNFNGKLSNASIWNTALTSAQVTELYNEGLPGNLNSHSAYSNLVSWWQLGENSSFDGNDWIVADEKGTNNGTSTGMPVGALVNGVGTTANGVSSGMSEGNLVGDAPYSTANAISTNMVVTSRVSGSGNTP